MIMIMISTSAMIVESTLLELLCTYFFLAAAIVSHRRRGFVSPIARGLHCGDQLAPRPHRGPVTRSTEVVPKTKLAACKTLANAWHEQPSCFVGLGNAWTLSSRCSIPRHRCDEQCGSSYPSACTTITAHGPPARAAKRPSSRSRRRRRRGLSRFEPRAIGLSRDDAARTLNNTTARDDDARGHESRRGVPVGAPLAQADESYRII